MVKYGNCSSSMEGMEKNAMLTRRRRENEGEAARKKKKQMMGARDVLFFLIARHSPISILAMQSLLRWSIENSTPRQDGDRQPVTQQQKLDTGIIDMILGRPDAEQMKEDVSAASDESKSEDERLAALDHLEMVGIERLD